MKRKRLRTYRLEFFLPLAPSRVSDGPEPEVWQRRHRSILRARRWARNIIMKMKPRGEAEGVKFGRAVKRSERRNGGAFFPVDLGEFVPAALRANRDENLGLFRMVTL